MQWWWSITAASAIAIGTMMMMVLVVFIVVVDVEKKKLGGGIIENAMEPNPLQPKTNDLTMHRMKDAFHTVLCDTPQPTELHNTSSQNEPPSFPIKRTCLHQQP